MFKTIFFILAFYIGTFVTYPTYGEELSGVQKEIWNLENNYFEFWKNEDRKGFAELLSEEAVIWGNKSAWPKDKGFMGHGATTGDGIVGIFDSYELELHELKIIGNIAISAYYAQIVRFGTPHKFRITHIWLKQDTKWVIISTMHDSCLELPNCL